MIQTLTDRPTETIAKDEWYTPEDVAKRVQEFFSPDWDPQGFLDPASCETANKVLGATRFYTKEQDGLSLPWEANIWINPPYSQPLLGQYIQKLHDEIEIGRVENAIVLVNGATDTTWFHSLAEKASARVDVKGRLKFWNPEKTSDRPRYNNVIFYFNEGFLTASYRGRFARIFGDLGLTYSCVTSAIDEHDVW